jgi:hypothetical protein
MKEKDFPPTQKQEGKPGTDTKDFCADAYVAPMITKHKNLIEITRELDDTFSVSW